MWVMDDTRFMNRNTRTVDVMEVRRAVLLSAILSNLLTLECSVLLNSARAPSVNTQFALLGILKFQDYRILVPRSRLTSYLNTSETTETTGICILHSCGTRPANEVSGVALFPSSSKLQRIVFQCSLIEEPNDAVRIMLTRLQHSDR